MLDISTDAACSCFLPAPLLISTASVSRDVCVHHCGQMKVRLCECGRSSDLSTSSEPERGLRSSDQLLLAGSKLWSALPVEITVDS